MRFLSDLMASILEFFYSYLGNWGYAIIGLTLIVRLIIWPLTIKQQKSLKRMQEIQPQLKKLQEKYKNNPEKLNKEMLALYQKHGVNPMGMSAPFAAVSHHHCPFYCPPQYGVYRKPCLYPGLD